MKLIPKFLNPSGTILPILVTPTKVGHDYTVYDNREMLPEGAELSDDERHKQEAKIGAIAVNRAQNAAAKPLLHLTSNGLMFVPGGQFGMAAYGLANLYNKTQDGSFSNFRNNWNKGKYLNVAKDVGLTALDIAATIPAVSKINNTINLGKQYNKIKGLTSALLDPYTDKSAILGYYGNNKINRIYGTFARNFNLPDIARKPELLRKIEKSFKVTKDGKIDMTSRERDWQRTNFTTDRPVVTHQIGRPSPWDHQDLYIVNPLKIDWSKAKSIEPSDTFFPDYDILLEPKDVTIISGNTEMLNHAKNNGLKTLSSKKLRQLYNLMININQKSWIQNQNNFFWKGGIKNTVPGKLKLQYLKEQQRLLSLRGTPKYKDYKLLEQQTGLNAGVSNKNFIDDLLNATRLRYLFTFPNGYRAQSIQQQQKLIDIFNRLPYNNIYYDPASPVEYYYKINNGIIDFNIKK